MNHAIATECGSLPDSGVVTSYADTSLQSIINSPPRVTWVLRSFLDYRVPVFAALDKLINGQLHVVFPDTQTPQRCRDKLRAVLGERAVELTGEKSIGTNKPSRGFANSSWVVPYQPGLLRAIQETAPDVVVGDGFFQWSVPALIYRLRHGVPFVVCYERTAHTERRAQWYRRWYRKLASRFVDAACCNGILSKEYTQTFGIPPNRITTGFMAADSHQLAQRVAVVTDRQRKRLCEQHRVEGVTLLFVGQLVPRKGVQELLCGWREFENQHAGDATLLIVGEGDGRAEYERYTAANGLKNVRFVGAVDYDQIAPYYAAADVVVMPTLEDNWSLVVPEAMACGKSVLCSKYNGAWPELIDQGANGWLFDPLQVESVTACLAELVACRAELAQMGQRSLEIVANFSPESAALAILKASQLAIEYRK